MVVERRKLAIPGVADHRGEATLFSLAGEQGNAHRLGLADVLRHLRQHRDATGDMKPADADRQTGCEKDPRQVDRPGKLIGLNPDQSDQGSAVGLSDHPDDLVGLNAPIGFIVGVQAQFDVRSEHVAGARVFREAVQTRQRVGRNGRPEPLDGIAVVVVVRRLDHHQMKQLLASGQRAIGSFAALTGHQAPPVAAASERQLPDVSCDW